MTFNIGNQTGGTINNVIGNQQIHGGQQGTVITLDTARQAAHALHQAIATARLPTDVADTARRHTNDIAAEIDHDQPDQPAVADRLQQLIALLTSTGSLLSAATPIAGHVQTLISWLGHLGAPIARLLPF